MGKKLFVTMSDANYLHTAKALFSSLYWNAGWKGDCMLLTHNVPEKDLKWFRDRGILVRGCKLLEDGRERTHSAMCFTKFYVFGVEFKKWDNVIYVDSDAIVRASLDGISDVKGFWAVNDAMDLSRNVLVDIEEGELPKLKEFKSIYNPKSKALNSGVLVFSTDIIERGTFNELLRLLREFGGIDRSADQLLIALLFYNKWRELPIVYNMLYPIHAKTYGIPDNKVDGIILHFATLEKRYKPWTPGSLFYEEWRGYLERADAINFNRPTPGAKRVWSKRDITEYTKYIERRKRIAGVKRIPLRIAVLGLKQARKVLGIKGHNY